MPYISPALHAQADFVGLPSEAIGHVFQSDSPWWHIEMDGPTLRVSVAIWEMDFVGRSLDDLLEDQVKHVQQF